MKLFGRLRGGIETQRLLLRRWEHKDFQAYVMIVSDPEVMEAVPCKQSLDRVRAAAGQMGQRVYDRGPGRHGDVCL